MYQQNNFLLRDSYNLFCNRSSVLRPDDSPLGEAAATPSFDLTRPSVS
jgi:hypothetical protein